MTLCLIVVLLLPYFLETRVRTGFGPRTAQRAPLFYILAPLTSLLVYGAFAAVLGHPFVAFVGWFILYGGLTLVSNIKNSILGEPLLAPDLETTRHLFIYPEFYVDYVGRWRFFSVIAGFLGGIILSYFTETSFAARLLPALPGPAAWGLILLAYSLAVWLMARLLAIWLAHGGQERLGLNFDISRDIRRYGLFGLMALYGAMLMTRPDRTLLAATPLPATAPAAARPDLIALQAESYFDVNRLYRLLPEHENHIWPKLDALANQGAEHGMLEVPAWGASTMQSEFSFLTGIVNQSMGIDRINPYLRMAGQDVPALARTLKAAGYRTVCLHPAKKEFFRRHRVIPALGFDEFVGLDAFDNANRMGMYVSDAALGAHIEQLISDHHAVSSQPLFLFAITIESHGPWVPGRLNGLVDEEKLVAADPTGDHAFALYRYHMDNALDLFARLGPNATPARPRAMVLYGDHQPALHDLFSRHGLTDRRVNYLLWNTLGMGTGGAPLKVEDLAQAFLATAGFKRQDIEG